MCSEGGLLPFIMKAKRGYRRDKERREAACRLLAMWIRDLSLDDLRGVEVAMQDELRRREEGAELCPPETK